ncbi:MAG: hypothetical protein ABI134_10545 [Byssovorax sp.]
MGIGFTTPDIDLGDLGIGFTAPGIADVDVEIGVSAPEIAGVDAGIGLRGGPRRRTRRLPPVRRGRILSLGWKVVRRLT